MRQRQRCRAGRFPRTPAIREALAKATPESLRRFEERYGPAERGCAVVHGDGTITVRRIAVDGSASTTVLEGEEALLERGELKHRSLVAGDSDSPYQPVRSLDGRGGSVRG
jgi:hypothetical protein